MTVRKIILVHLLVFIIVLPVSAQGKDGLNITDLSWKIGNAVISEACVEDNVQITFNAVNISGKDDVIIRIFEENGGGNDDLIAEIIYSSAGKNNSMDWIVEFDEAICKTSASELEKDGFTIPEYYFIVKHGGCISGKSNTIKIYGYIDIILTGADKKTLPHRPYIIFFANGAKHEGMSDGDGRIKIRNAVIGDRYIMVGDEE
jgi:hypothetical protein